MKPLFRNVKSEDFKKIKLMMEEAWKYQEMFEENFMGEIVVDAFLNEVLHNSSYSQVAELEGEVVGVIFGKVDSEASKLRMLESHMGKQIRDVLTASKEDQETYINYYETTSLAHETLMGNKNKRYDSSIELFLVEEKARGHRIGSTLLKGIENYFHQHHAKRVYLYTDTECNYRFYDYKGFIQVEEWKPLIPSKGFPGGFTYYLYEKKYS